MMPGVTSFLQLNYQINEDSVISFNGLALMKLTTQQKESVSQIKINK